MVMGKRKTEGKMIVLFGPDRSKLEFKPCQKSAIEKYLGRGYTADMPKESDAKAVRAATEAKEVKARPNRKEAQALVNAAIK